MNYVERAFRINHIDDTNHAVTLSAPFHHPFVVTDRSRPRTPRVVNHALGLQNRTSMAGRVFEVPLIPPELDHELTILFNRLHYNNEVGSTSTAIRSLLASAFAFRACASTRCSFSALGLTSTS